MKLFKLIADLLEAELYRATAAIKSYEFKTIENQWYIEAGKAIEDIVNLYPASAEDAAIIFEEWCKGLLTECRPDHDVLREYAKYVSNPIKFRTWAKHWRYDADDMAHQDIR